MKYTSQRQNLWRLFKQMLWLQALFFTCFTSFVAAQEIIFAVPAENFGYAFNVKKLSAPGANGNNALVLAETSIITGGVKLPAGAYTLFLRTFAPSGDKDGFFVEINGQRTRRTAPIGSWSCLAFPFALQKDGEAFISLIGQEPGLWLDDVVLVKGSLRDSDIDTTKLVSSHSSERVGIQGLTRLKMPCRLREFPLADINADAQESFEAEPKRGLIGEAHLGAGYKGQGLVLQMPDGRFDWNVSSLGALPAGTIAFWIRPRPAAQIWIDQGWHYLLHGQPRQPEGARLDLSRRPDIQLQLSFSTAQHIETLSLRTEHLDLQQWHHVLVSWDFRGERQYIWLLVDGQGMQAFFPRVFSPLEFRFLQFGNTPSMDNIPFLPLDGSLDEILISRTAITEWLAQEDEQ